MEKERLSILKSETWAQIEEIEKIYHRLKERGKEKGTMALESIAFQLHNLYCAFEDLFKIVAGMFENSVQSEGRYHIELLKRMCVKIEGIRPALISPESFRLLDSLRAFRHFFRHAYAYELDGRKVLIVLEDAWKLRKIYRKDIEVFFSTLQ